MKKLFLLLVLINAGIFLIIKLNILGQATTGQPQMKAEKVRLAEISNMMDKSSGAEKTRTELTYRSEELQPEIVEPRVANQVKTGKICFEWGDFSGTDLARATEIVNSLSDEEKVSRKEIEHESGYWIYMGPLKNKQKVNKKISELKEIGVTDYFVINAGRWKNTISLGVFKSENSANSYFNTLKNQGVRTAKLGERTSKYKTTTFVLSNVKEETKHKIREIQKDFPGSELKDVQCGLTS
ncbi:MAG: hypothetical protein OEY89_09515 [Gammaproteobacteria bacterium]|nr:hypothetical protein [Gammaproteobacteria bacterium]